ncbi:hypothetical protein SAY86_014488 [Trapa natans]|uniref:Uncharacterized protein n=1 Tax=Trapa natans TaxID=22666 RepID=A0AAN7QQY9_TRANT|nr:hypothetical protein SAY86_014488 [Trapa natans]
MADDLKRQGDVVAPEGDDSIKRQKTAPLEGEEAEVKDEEHAGGASADFGEDILAWLTDLDDQTVRELMMNLFEPSPAPADDASSTPWSSRSCITINTGNEESCGSSYSDAPSVMASFDAAGIAGRAVTGGTRDTFVSWEEKSSPSYKMSEWGSLADDDGDGVLGRFLGEYL